MTDPEIETCENFRSKSLTWLLALDLISVGILPLQFLTLCRIETLTLHPYLMQEPV